MQPLRCFFKLSASPLSSRDVHISDLQRCERLRATRSSVAELRSEGTAKESLPALSQPSSLRRTGNCRIRSEARPLPARAAPPSQARPTPSRTFRPSGKEHASMINMHRRKTSPDLSVSMLGRCLLVHPSHFIAQLIPRANY